MPFNIYTIHKILEKTRRGLELFCFILGPGNFCYYEYQAYSNKLGKSNSISLQLMDKLESESSNALAVCTFYIENYQGKLKGQEIS